MIRKEIADWIEEAEGGYSDDPVDMGGQTNMGITHNTINKAYDKGIVPYNDVTKLTKEDALKIYEIMYYNEAKCDELIHPLDWVHFDMAVNSGPKNAGILLQYSINEFPVGGTSIEVDGVIGPNTLNALDNVINLLGQTSVINSYLMYRMIFYNNIVRNSSSQIRFLSGWLNRVTKLKKRIKGD